MRNEVFVYNNAPITFQLGNGDVMVNATEMAKPFDREVKNYLRLPSTNELLTAYVRKNHVSENQLVTIKQGSSQNGGGTWLHEDIALDFAQWLSIDFKLWCNDRLKELLKHGMTAMPETIEQLIANPDTLIQLATQLKTERAEKERLAMQNRLANEQIKLSQPKVEYYEQVLQSSSLVATNVIADQLGISAKRLNNLLCEHNVIYRQNDTFVLYAKYRGKGYEGYKTHTYLSNSTGQQHTKKHLYWTEKGCEFIHEFIGKIVNN